MNIVELAAWIFVILILGPIILFIILPLLILFACTFIGTLGYTISLLIVNLCIIDWILIFTILIIILVVIKEYNKKR